MSDRHGEGDAHAQGLIDWAFFSCFRIMAFWLFCGALLFGEAGILDDHTDMYKLLDPRVSHREALANG